MDMEIKSQTTVTISVPELTKILKDHIKKTKGLDIEYINYRIATVYDSGDWQSMYPSDKLDCVICKTKDQ